MKRLFLLGLLCLLLFSCKKHTSKLKQTNNSSVITSSGFELNGKLENFYPKKVYLNKIIGNSIYPIDSSEVIDNTFKFKGIVEFPERFGLTFENYSAVSVIILENSKFEVFINAENINDPIISGSKLNTELYKYKLNSKNIFKKIEFLFPQFQKARLENDVKKLNDIEVEMKKIETEFINFSYDYIIQNKESSLAVMILRDQLKSRNIDTIRIKNTYEILSSEVKKTPDAEIIADFFNLH